MTKTILVATDGSDHAERAVAMAVDLAGIHEGRIVLLHVLPDVVNERVPKHLEKLVELERVDLGEALNGIGDTIVNQAQRQALELGAKDIETVVTTGNPAKQILESADLYNADFIVMGGRGLGNLEGLFLGSVSHKVTHLAKQTCITVR